MQKMLKQLVAGDLVASGLYAGAWQQGTRVVARVEPARARGYFVVTFTDNRSTSGHGSQVAGVAERQVPGTSYQLTLGRLEVVSRRPGCVVCGCIVYADQPHTAGDDAGEIVHVNCDEAAR